MKIDVDRNVLADAVAWTARGLPARPALPVLAGLMLAAQDDVLTASGFDYEVSARVSVGADIAEPGRVLVSGRLLAEITRSLPDRPVELTSDGTKVTLRCGSTRFTLPTLPVEDYPELPDMPSASGSVAGASFAAAVGQVTIAAGRDDTLPVLTGIRMEIDGSTLTMAATDRYRLAIREIAWSPEQSGLSVVALAPARTLNDTAKALAATDKVTLALASASAGAGAGLLGFEGGGRRTTTRLLDGEFPKYRSLLPQECASVAVVETATFIESVKRVSLVAERNTPIRLSFSDGLVSLEAGAGDDAQASESLEATLEGDDISTAFNPVYLLDGLNALQLPYAQLAFTLASKPAVLTGRAEADAEPVSSYQYVIMPVRLSG